MKKIKIESMYDGWYLFAYGEDNKVCYSARWDHEDFAGGVGGEKYVADFLKYLGHEVLVQDVG